MITYESNENVAELRRDALVILLAIAIGSWLITFIISLVYYDITQINTPILPLIVVFGAILGSNLLRQQGHVGAAAWLLISGLIVGPALFLDLQGPNTAGYFTILIPVVITSLLIGDGSEFRVAGVVILITVGVTAAWQPDLSPSSFANIFGATAVPGGVCLIMACIGYLNTRNIFAMTRWAIDSQHKDSKRARALYEQYEQLTQTLRRLEYANSRFALLNAELAEARRTADTANRHKTQFLASVSHELRAPLNIILMCAQPSTSALSPALLHPLELIRGSAEQLDHLINDLLDVSRAEMNTLEVSLEPLETGAFLAEVFHNIVDSQPPGQAIEWTLSLPSGLPPLQADPLRLRQILFNLLSNAAHSTTEGHIGLGAELAWPYMHIWVEDTGCGIPFENQARIFEPFFSGSQHPKRIGLGLYITRQLVKLHNGLLTLDSQPAMGTTFHLYLPLPAPDQPALVRQARQPVLLLLSTHEHIADDIIELSQRQGHTLHRLRPADDLSQLLAEVEPVGLIWDLSETTADGWELVQRLRSYPRLGRLPVTLYSQNAASNLALGMTNFLVKPLKSATVAQAVHALQRPAAATSILIVDDDPQALALYQRLLSEVFPDHALQTAANGAAALGLLDRITPGLVILDLMMPEVDGFTVLDAIRSNPATQKIPVLVLSGRILSLDDLKRLDQARVVFQSKDLLSGQEIGVQTRRLLEASDLLPQHTSTLVKQAIAYIHQNYTTAVSRPDIASFVGVSERHITRLFNQELGLPPGEYLTRYRIMRAKRLLRTTTDSIASIASQVGFDDPAHFSRTFRKEVRLSPTEYREAGE